ncbi:hypothetical protein F4055_17125 [Candidatus Poribacteria bacterium]|nr:hypothetical protein [Candidatus Poribacteria bacterium]
MTSIRVWNLESDHDTQAVKFLDNEFARFRQTGQLAIRTAGRSALRKCHKRGEPSSSCLSKTIRYYLNQDDYIIFLADSEILELDHQERREPNSLVDQLRRVTKIWNFSNKVIFAPEIQDFQSSVTTWWENIVSDFPAEPEGAQEQFREEWDRIMTRIHDIFKSTSDDKLTNNLDAAIRHYQEGEVTLGRAAELAGLHRFEFEEALAARNIWKIVEVDSAEELKAGVSLIKSLHKSDVSTEEQ